MSTRERKQREFAGREQLFLDKSRELISCYGLLNLSMARIAEECDYAVGTLYQHFTSKEDLLMALVTEDTRTHADMFRRIAQWDATPRDRMFAVGVADMVFVSQHPEHFRLAQYVLTEVVWGAASAARRETLLKVNQPLGEIVHDIVRDAVRKGHLELNGMTPEEVCIGPWSLTIGMHNLVHAEGVLERFVHLHEPYRLMCRHYQIQFNGLNWRPLLDASDDAALDALIQRIRKEVFDDFCTK